MNQITHSRDLTGADLSSHMPAVRATGGMHIGFFYQRVQVSTVGNEKNGTVETRLCVAKQPKGDPRTMVHRFITPEDAAKQFPQEYALFTQFEDVPDYGTPLSELPGMSRSQISMLDVAGLRCIEDLKEISADDAAQLGMDVSRARKLAVAWLQKRDDAVEEITAADVQARAEASIKAMEQRLAKMEANALRLEAENNALRSVGGGQRVAQQASAGAVAHVGIETDLAIDPNDGFMAGGDVVVGGDDLGDSDPNPLED